MNKAIMFVLGAAAGSLLTWKLLEKKYKQLADEEIESVIEHFRNKEKQVEKLESNTPEHFETEEKVELDEKVQNLGYAVYHNQDGTTEVAPAVDHVEPYVISPDEFGDTQFYDSKSWTYYADYVLTDEDGEIVCNPESIIGDALSKFGEYEDDAVHVRNENTECDYEILRHDKTFSEINGEDS